MKILKLDVADYPFLSKKVQTELETELIRDELKKAGFDVHRGFEVYQGVNSFYYLFIQEDQLTVEEYDSQVKKLTGKELEDFIGEHKGLIAALFDSENSYYCDTCDGLRVKGHQCYCFFCKGSFPDSDKHLDCPELVEYKPKKME